MPVPYLSQWEGCQNECYHMIDIYCYREIGYCLDCASFCLKGETNYSLMHCRSVCPGKNYSFKIKIFFQE